MRKLSLFLFVLSLAFSLKSFALVLDLNLFYDTRSLKTSSTETDNKMFIEGAVLLDIIKKPRIVLGWSYGIYSTTDTTTGTTTISTSDMGPRLGWFFDKDNVWSLSLTYNILGTASYSPSSGTAETWRGTSLKADLGWAPPITDTLNLGIRLNYYAANYTESISSGSYSTVSYTRSFIYPSVYLSYHL